MIEELREGLRALAAAEPVNAEVARRAVQARARTARRRRWLPTAVLSLAAVVMIVGGAALFSRRSGGVRVSTRPPQVEPARPLGRPMPTIASTITTITAPATTVTAAAVTPTTARGSSEPGSVPVPVDLVFTGRYPGHVVTGFLAGSGLIVGPHNGSPSAPPACTTSFPTDQTGAVIGVQGALAGRPFILGYDGVVTNVENGLSEGFLFIGHDPLTYNDALGFDTKSLVFDPDRLGAHVDSDLYSNSTAGGRGAVVGHVTGHFRCAP